MIVWSARVRTAADAKPIKEWLDASGIVYADVFTGKGKPPAHAYVDDRAVVCEPQKDGPGAFLAAGERIRELVECVDTKKREPPFEGSRLQNLWRLEFTSRCQTRHGDWCLSRDWMDRRAFPHRS